MLVFLVFFSVKKLMGRYDSRFVEFCVLCIRILNPEIPSDVCGLAVSKLLRPNLTLSCGFLLYATKKLPATPGAAQVLP